MATTADAGTALSAGVQRLLETARALVPPGQELGLNHWLIALAGKHGRMMEDLTGTPPATVIDTCRSALDAGDTGGDFPLERLVELAAEDGGKLTERAAAAALVAAAGLPLAAPHRATGFRPETPDPAGRTPTLDRFGRDLTAQARAGLLPKLVGREHEVELAVEVLCRATKRNPVFIGPAGVGKTAIAEGIAQRIAAGDVPEHLAGVRIVAIQPSSLVAGSGVVGELQKRMEAILEESSTENIVLFIDEVHSIVGAGGREGSGDIGALLKPALARGQIACIGATTDDEYRRFIEPDRALERRFNVIRVLEMSADETREVLLSHRDRLEASRKVAVADGVVDWLVRFADQQLKNRRFPDKAVDLLEQCVARAVACGSSSVDIAMAEEVARRMIGMPLDVGERLETLRQTGKAFLDISDVEELVTRLNVTLRGLDVRSERPNAVLLLVGDRARIADRLAGELAEALYGNPERTVAVDFGQYDKREDLNSFLGPPPGYIGFGDRLALHAIKQMPWSVLLCEHIDRCHPAVLDLLEDALANGTVTERSGERIHLADCVVVLTAQSVSQGAPSFGFGGREAPSKVASLRAAAEERLGADLLRSIDVIAVDPPQRADCSLSTAMLSRLAARYRLYGVQLEWTPDFTKWLDRLLAEASEGAVEQRLEAEVGVVVIPLLEQADRPQRVLLDKNETVEAWPIDPEGPPEVSPIAPGGADREERE